MLIHFNDCYNVEAQKTEPVGGATRFCTAVKSLRPFNPLVLFSGDILAPSIMSTFTKGDQMVPVLNSIQTDCAVYGNHDFGAYLTHAYTPRRLDAVHLRGLANTESLNLGNRLFQA